MKIVKLTYIVIAWVIELFAFQRWFSCWLFKENFYFTFQNLSTRLINETNADKGMPVLLVRLIHNKPFTLGWGLLQMLLQYWDIRFLEEFIGVVGVIGVGFGIWYMFTKDRKNIFLWILLGLGIVLPVFVGFSQPHIQFSINLFALGFIFQFFSLYGLWKFLEKSHWIRYVFVTFLFVISVMFLALFPLLYLNFCLKI